MLKTQSGRFGGTAWAILLTAGVCIALASVTPAQDGQVYQGDRRQVVFSGDNRAYYAPQYSLGCYGGPYKGFYPCNAKTPYYGGACSVYGDAPIYSAPADYGHHCAAWCP